MSRSQSVLLAVLVGGLASPSSAILAQAQNEPGLPTVAQMYILNRQATDAIPVKVSDIVPVTIMGAPAVTLPPTTVVGARLVRQGWEYRQITADSAQSAMTALNAAGGEGWEAIGSTSAGANGTVWTLKRPRQ